MNLFIHKEKNKGQDPLKEKDLGNKIIQARDSDEFWQNNRRDKKNNPQPSINCEQFQKSTNSAKKTTMEQASHPLQQHEEEDHHLPQEEGDEDGQEELSGCK
jgi:hypothetical protein